MTPTFKPIQTNDYTIMREREIERESSDLENNFVVMQFTSKLFKQKTNALANAREL